MEENQSGVVTQGHTTEWEGLGWVGKRRSNVIGKLKAVREPREADPHSVGSQENLGEQGGPNG